MRKEKLLTIIGIVMMMISLAGCTMTSDKQSDGPDPEPAPFEPEANTSEGDEPEPQPEPGPDLEQYKIMNAGSFPQDECEARGLEGKAIMIESRYCGHCATTKPEFITACNQSAVEPTIIDIVDAEGRDWLKDKAISLRGTPTFIFDCEYFVGARSEREYKQKLEEMSYEEDEEE